MQLAYRANDSHNFCITNYPTHATSCLRMLCSCSNSRTQQKYTFFILITTQYTTSLQSNKNVIKLGPIEEVSKRNQESMNFLFLITELCTHTELFGGLQQIGSRTSTVKFVRFQDNFWYRLYDFCVEGWKYTDAIDFGN